MNIFLSIRKLSKTTYAQNLFLASKEINGIKLFKNNLDLSKLQQLYLSYLYMYNGIMQDIQIEKISKHVLDNEIYEDSYLLWKREKGNKTKKEDNTERDVKLVMSNTIRFPKKEVK